MGDQDSPPASGVEEAGGLGPPLGVDGPGREDVEVESRREQGLHVPLEGGRVSRRILVGEHGHAHRDPSLRPDHQLSW